MTLREADEAARRCLPVVHDGITYRRITEIGYRFDNNGQRSGFVVLLDRGGWSVTYAAPERIIYADPPWSYTDAGCQGAAAAQYQPMTIEELKQLPVNPARGGGV